MDGIQATSNSILFDKNDNGWDKALGCAVPISITLAILLLSLVSLVAWQIS